MEPFLSFLRENPNKLCFIELLQNFCDWFQLFANILMSNQRAEDSKKYGSLESKESIQVLASLLPQR